MKNNQTMKNDEVELANNPVRDLSSVETFTRQNTACRRYATSLFDLLCCIPTACLKGVFYTFSTKFLSLRDIGVSLIETKKKLRNTHFIIV